MSTTLESIPTYSAWEFCKMLVTRADQYNTDYAEGGGTNVVNDFVLYFINQMMQDNSEDNGEEVVF